MWELPPPLEKRGRGREKEKIRKPLDNCDTSGSTGM
jgi:hypothetical protein